METRNAKSTLDNYLRNDLKRLSLEQCWEVFKLMKQRIRHLENIPAYMKIPLEELGLSTRACNILATAGLFTSGDIINYGFDRILMLRSCGP